ncbi:hypothetical protein Pmani_000295 [Petrolisthes manimaculis]|uniref:Galactosylgalactosylxylosylprotein 3-beta-glucuronosyltransferase n=1 Tax=Petrolisthes manimaculis TaxID=1843537 RepID=A0AAE1UQH4_9EUCA|nr:hypothetical protein Pmani_000295 [Petrolisthes manimaculis]
MIDAYLVTKQGMRSKMRCIYMKTLGLWVAAGLVLVILGLAVRPSTRSPHTHQELDTHSTQRALHAILHHPPPQPLPQPQQQQQPCQQQEKDQNVECEGCRRGRWVEGLPTLYIVTPTYPRAEQVPEITRTAQTLMHVPNLVWLVSEDASVSSPALLSYLNESGLNTVYLRVQMPSKYQKVKNKPRGVANRMAGLNWVRSNGKEGVIYFADDDNTYDIRIFEQIRWTRKVSMFPVGLVTSLGVSTPIVRSGQVVGFYDGWIAHRTFPVDMAGFAVNVEFLLQRPQAGMPYKVGYEEDGFIKSLGIKASEIEPLAFNCTKIWVWHTQTKKNEPAKPVAQNNATIGTNMDILKEQLWKGPGTKGKA